MDDMKDAASVDPRFFDPATKTGRLRKACYDLLMDHHRKGEIPTTCRFLFYELEQRGIVPKKYPDKVKQPYNDINAATVDLREAGLIPWAWLDDATRSASKPSYRDTIAEDLIGCLGICHLNVWGDDEPPLILCESRGVATVLSATAREYGVALAATGGQSAGFLVNDIAPLVGDDREVLYIGDWEIGGPGDDIEANSRRYLEEHADREFDEGTWSRIALTSDQVNGSARLKSLIIEKTDRRYLGGKTYQAVECEALGQTEIVRIVRDRLDERLSDLDMSLAAVRAEEDRQRARLRKLLRDFIARDARRT